MDARDPSAYTHLVRRTLDEDIGAGDLTTSAIVPSDLRGRGVFLVKSECVLAGELRIAYAAVCVVDNLANGVGDTPLTMAEFYAGAAANRARLLGALDAVLPALAKDDSAS